MVLVKAEKITYSSQDRRFAGVSELSFEAEKSKLTVILGKNNSGKSAIVRLSDALILPSEGKMTVCGMDTSDVKALRDIRKKCGVIFEHQRELFFTDTPREELRFSLRCAGISEKTAGESIEKAKELTGIESFEDTQFPYLGELEVLKASAAVSLVTSPEILIFDGSTASLSDREKEDFFAMLKKLTASDLGVILTTSDAEDAVNADRVILMHKGCKKGEGTAREILTDIELLKETETRPPFTVRVYYDLLEADAKLGEIPLTTDELVKEICR